MEALRQAKELSEKILSLTQALILTGEKENADAETDAYVALLDEREPLINELTDLRLQLDETEITSDEFAAIKSVITQITDLDKMHLAVMERLRESAQKSYRGVKRGQRIHAGYNPLSGDEAPSRIDLKQ
jgi:hypothetical protein